MHLEQHLLTQIIKKVSTTCKDIITWSKFLDYDKINLEINNRKTKYPKIF